MYASIETPHEPTIELATLGVPTLLLLVKYDPKITRASNSTLFGRDSDTL